MVPGMYLHLGATKGTALITEGDLDLKEMIIVSFRLLALGPIGRLIFCLVYSLIWMEGP